MKLVQTLLIEIKKPVGTDPAIAYRRLRALTRTCAQGLNITMMECQPKAVEQLRAQWDGDSKQKRSSSEDWRSRVRTILAHNWNARLERERLDRVSEDGADEVYAKINGSALAEETATNITAAFSGQNVKELVALRKRFPTFGIQTPFYCGGRFCSISGSLKQTIKGTFPTEKEAKQYIASSLDAGEVTLAQLGGGLFTRRSNDKWQVVHEDSARISIPIWGTGKKVTEFIIGPAGGHARATWRRLADHFARRDEIVQAEKELDAIRRTEAEKKAIESLKAAKKGERDRVKRKEIDTQIKAAEQASNKRMQSLRDPLEAKLYGLTKIGRVGVVWNERRRKWFVTVSFTQYLPPASAKGQAAAVNFGINRFLQAVAQDGSDFRIEGTQILQKQQAFYSIRKRIQLGKRHFGRGSRGHGKRRRELPLTKRQGDESNWKKSFIRTAASDLIKWCKFHGVAVLYLEDLSGVRDAFEQSTEGQAHEEVKRLIHTWPYGETRVAIMHEAMQNGIQVVIKGTRFVSQRCPSCGHIDPENVEEVTIPGPVISLRSIGKGRWEESSPVRDCSAHGEIDTGDLYRRQDKTYRFECQKCTMRGQVDVVSCLNHLQDVGALPAPKPNKPVKSPLDKMQEAARKAVTTDKRKKSRKKGA